MLQNDEDIALGRIAVDLKELRPTYLFRKRNRWDSGKTIAVTTATKN